MKRKLKPEEIEQIAVVRYLTLKKIDFFAVVNESNTNYNGGGFIMGSHLKKMGKRAGVTDLVIFLNDKILFLEMKKKRPKLKNGKESMRELRSREQLEFCEMANKYQYAVCTVAYGAEKAIQIIENIK